MVFLNFFFEKLILKKIRRQQKNAKLVNYQLGKELINGRSTHTPKVGIFFIVISCYDTVTRFFYMFVCAVNSRPALLFLILFSH